MIAPQFTHEELMVLANAMAQFAENHDEEPSNVAVSALEKLDAYVASLVEVSP